MSTLFIKKNYILISVLFFGISARLFLFFYSLPQINNLSILPDSNDYLALADNIIANGSYAKDGIPEIFRALGYPVFLVPFRYFFPNSIISIVIFQIFLDIINAFIVYIIAKNIFSKKTYYAKYVIVLQITSIVSIVFSSKILSETLFTTFLLIIILLLQHLTLASFSNINKKSILLTISIALLFGCLCLIRAIALPLIPLVAIFLWYKTKRKILAFLFCFISSLIILSWGARNYINANYAGFSSVGSINLYRYYACAITASNEKRSFNEVQNEYSANLAKFKTQSEAAEFAKTEGLKIIIKNPFKSIYLHLKSDINILFPAVGDLFKMLGYKIGGSGTLEVIHNKGIIEGIKHYFNGSFGLFYLSIPIIILLILKYSFSLLAIVYLFYSFIIKRCKNDAFLFLLVLLSLYFILIPGAVATPRFRVPVEPFLAILAVYGYMLLRTKIIPYLKK